MIWLLAASAWAGAPPNGELVAGWGGNLSEGFGFVTFVPAIGRLSDATFVVHATASYLDYDVVYLGTHTRVTSPGVSIGPGFKFGSADLSLGLAVGFEGRYTTRFDVGVDPTHTVDLGAFVSADVYWLPGGGRVALYGIGSFSTANAYLWTRAGVKFQLIPLFERDTPAALWLGVDGTARGNHDARAVEAGVVAEVPLRDAHASLSVRAGPSLEQSLDPNTGTWTSSLQGTVGIGAYWSY